MRWISVTLLLVIAGCGSQPRPVSPPAPAPVTTPNGPVSEHRAYGARSQTEIIRRAAALAAAGHGFTKDTAIFVVVLEGAEILILGPIGPMGSRSGLETAAREIADRPDAKAAADYLVRHGIGAPRLYGLWILGAVDAIAAAAAATTLRTDRSEVESARGCMRGPPEPFAQLVDEVLARPMWRPGHGRSI